MSSHWSQTRKALHSIELGYILNGSKLAQSADEFSFLPIKGLLRLAYNTYNSLGCGELHVVLLFLEQDRIEG
jgi:hypothetical protein